METSTKLGRVSLAPRGEYNESSTYNRLDLVQFKGSGYIVRKDNLIGVTPTDGPDYMLLTEHGSPGEPGRNIVSVERTAGSGTPGSLDTYTITFSDGDTLDFQVYNGRDGDGAGDMTTTVYDPRGLKTDIYKYVDEHTPESVLTIPDGGEVSTPNVAELTEGPWTLELTAESEDANGDLIEVIGGADGKDALINGQNVLDIEAGDNIKIETQPGKLIISSTATASGDDLINNEELQAALAGKQDVLSGVKGQLVGFDEDGNAVAQDIPEGGVTSFNNRTGAVVPKSGDYTADMVGAVTEEQMNEAIQEAINGIPEYEGGVTSFNGRAGAVEPAEGDYTADMVGAVTETQMTEAIKAAIDDIPEVDVGVKSFNDRTGAIAPQAGDYTAEMVGARPDDWIPTAEDVGAVTPEQLQEAIQEAIIASWEASY